MKRREALIPEASYDGELSSPHTRIKASPLNCLDSNYMQPHEAANKIEQKQQTPHTRVPRRLKNEYKAFSLHLLALNVEKLPGQASAAFTRGGCTRL
jgi:hypothetical protein